MKIIIIIISINFKAEKIKMTRLDGNAPPLPQVNFNIRTNGNDEALPSTNLTTTP